jgi:capsular exopolysaccharide synthesis family protein
MSSLLISNGVQPSFAENFRSLASLVRATQRERNAHSILIASAYPRDGRSTTAANLALALAEGGRTVVLADADTLKPIQADVFGVPLRAGWTELLQGDPATGEPVTGYPPGFRLLPSGYLPPHGRLLPQPEAVTRALQSLGQGSDFAVLDSPALSQSSDAFILAPACDAVIYVVRHRAQDAAQQLAYRRKLEQVGARFLGVVFNEA